MKHETFVDGAQREVRLGLPEGKIVALRGAMADSDGKRVELIRAEISTDRQSGDAPMMDSRPDGAEKRSEFSQRVGC